MPSAPPPPHAGRRPGRLAPLMLALALAGLVGQGAWTEISWWRGRSREGEREGGGERAPPPPPPPIPASPPLPATASRPPAAPHPLTLSLSLFTLPSTASAARTLKQAVSGGLATYVLNPIGSRLPPGSINSNIPGLYSSPATGALPFNTLVARILPQFAPGTPAQLVQNNPFAFIANPNGGPLGQYLLWWGGNARPISLPTLPTPTGPSGVARYDFLDPRTFVLRASGQVNSDALTFVRIVSLLFLGGWRGRGREGVRGEGGCVARLFAPFFPDPFPVTSPLSFFPQGGNPGGTATPPPAAG